MKLYKGYELWAMSGMIYIAKKNAAIIFSCVESEEAAKDKIDGWEIQKQTKIMNTIQRIIEIPLSELQTEKAKNMDISLTSCCCICGNKIKEGAKTKMVHLLENGNIVSYEGSDIVGSQGFFPVGSECVKKLQIQFAF